MRVYSEFRCRTHAAGIMVGYCPLANMCDQCAGSTNWAELFCCDAFIQGMCKKIYCHQSNGVDAAFRGRRRMRFEFVFHLCGLMAEDRFHWETRVVMIVLMMCLSCRRRQMELLARRRCSQQCKYYCHLDRSGVMVSMTLTSTLAMTITQKHS